MENTQRVCPAREVLGFESSFARGRMLLARGILEGEIEYNDKLIERMYTCLGCGACKTHCPLEVDTIEVFRTMREDAVQKGIPLPKALVGINKAIEEHKNPFAKPQEFREKMARELALPKEGEIFYFAGCYDTLRFTENFTNTISILRKIGINPSYLGENEWCCGVPQFWNGSTDLAHKLAQHNVVKLKKAGAKQVIMSCAGCYSVFGHFYKQILGDLPFEVLHISQFLANKFNMGMLKLTNLEDKYEGNVTYHDPCHLGRHMGVYEEPRLLIKKMFPHIYREMPRNRENSWCCGGGAVVFPYLTQYSLRIAEQRIDEAVKIGAKTLVTTCPSCMNVLKIPARKKKIEVKNLLELLADAIENSIGS
jgi:Fe-S oxidoreductase